MIHFLRVKQLLIMSDKCKLCDADYWYHKFGTQMNFTYSPSTHTLVHTVSHTQIHTHTHTHTHYVVAIYHSYYTWHLAMACRCLFYNKKCLHDKFLMIDLTLLSMKTEKNNLCEKSLCTIVSISIIIIT